MNDPVDEDRRGAPDLAGREPALDVPADPLEHRGALPVGVEAVEVEPELRRVAAQVTVLQCLLAVEQQPISRARPDRYRAVTRHRSFTGDGWFQPSSPLLHRALRRVGDAPAMARIIVVAGSPAVSVGPALYEERVGTPVLEGAHASAQFLQRIAWAVADAEEAERESARSDLGFDAQRRGV